MEWIGSRQTGRRWMIACIKKLWEVAWDLWDHRNRVVHDQRDGVLDLKLRQEILLEFESGAAGLPRTARRMFAPGRAAILKYKLDAKQAWLIRVRSARSRQERRQAAGLTDTYQAERMAMSRWLALANPAAGRS